MGCDHEYSKQLFRICVVACRGIKQDLSFATEHRRSAGDWHGRVLVKHRPITDAGHDNNAVASIFREVMPDHGASNDADIDPQTTAGPRRQIVNYPTTESPGTIVIDTPNTYLYFVLGRGKAIRYGIGVGREGFTWSGVKTIERKSEWPDWMPPAEMLQRQPYLPRFMAGGPGNPLGARAMYLSGTVYRIHGTNAPDTIGKRVSSGCIRMLNDDVTDLYGRAQVGTKVVVLPIERRHFAQSGLTH
jgi:lipoprotein-anchoring transpeptidase ErfK/SrfK